MYAGGLAAHAKHVNIITLLTCRFFWPRLHQDASHFIEGCAICQTFKETSQNTNLYLPLPIPKTIWEDLSIDFILDLPETKRSFDFIIMVVDRFLIMSHFIPCKRTFNTLNIA